MRLDFFTMIAVVALMFFIVAVFFPRRFSRRRSAVVAVASPLAIASTVAVSAVRLVVASVASVASRSTVGIAASIVVASIAAAVAVRSTSVVSPAFAFARLATSVRWAARLALLAKVARERPLGAFAQPLDFVSFERAVDFALGKKRLEVRRERLDRLVGQFFA
jgi:hypothetical protein